MENRWKRKGSAIVWKTAEEALPHDDHLEMSGKMVSQYLEYGADREGKSHYRQKIVFPMLRTIPNNTHASLTEEFGQEVFPEIAVDGKAEGRETAQEVIFDGLLEMKGSLGALAISRRFFPCAEAAAAVQKVRLLNPSSQPVQVKVGPLQEERFRRGVHGLYVVTATSDFSGERTLSPGEELSFCVVYAGRKLLAPPEPVNGDAEEKGRLAFWENTRQHLCLRTPDPLLNQAFDFAKLRTSESVFRTRNGLMHSPGGLAFYAAVWTNDQAE